MYIPRAFSHQTEFFDAVEKVASGLPHSILSVTPTFGDDWAGEPAVFFQVVFQDGIPIPELAKIGRELRFTMAMELRPLEEWDVLPYFHYRTQAEQARIEESTVA